MKRKWVALLVVLFLVAGTAFLWSRGSNTRYVKRIATESTLYTDQEIRKCMDIAIHTFSGGFEGCKLLTVAYDETETIAEAKRHKEDGGNYQWMVLLSDFYTGKKAEACFNPNMVYRNWKWIFADNGNGWELIGSGYA